MEISAISCTISNLPHDDMRKEYDDIGLLSKKLIQRLGEQLQRLIYVTSNFMFTTVTYWAISGIFARVSK